MTAKRSSRKPRPYHHGELRRGLLDAAAELVLEHGPAGWTLREAARRLGVTHAAPYHHFASKEALLDALAEEGFADLASRLREAAAAPALSDSPVDEIERLGKAYVRFAADRPAHFRVMFRREANLPSAVSLREARTAAMTPLASVMKRAHSASLLEATDPMEAVVPAWCLVHGLATLWIDGALEQTRFGARELDALAALVTRTLSDGLRRR